MKKHRLVCGAVPGGVLAEFRVSVEGIHAVHVTERFSNQVLG